MLKSLLISIGLLLLCTVTLAKTTEVTIYCDEAYPPYAYSEGNEARGVYVEVLKKAFAKMPDYKITITPIAWKRGMKYVEDGDGFGIFPPYFKEERTKFGIYTEPILVENVVAVSKPALAKSIKKWPEDVFGKKVGINSGFTLGGDDFINAGKAGKIIIEEAKSNQMNIGKLNLDRIDYYINDKISILWEIKKMKLQKELKPDAAFDIAFSINQENGYLLITKSGKSKFPFNNDFVEKFNKIIKEMKDKGEISKIMEEYVK